MIVDAAARGLGLAQVPRWLVENQLSSGALIPVLSNVRMPTLPIHIIWPGGRALTSRVRVTIDAIAKHCVELRRAESARRNKNTIGNKTTGLRGCFLWAAKARKAGLHLHVPLPDSR